MDDGHEHFRSFDEKDLALLAKSSSNLQEKIRNMQARYPDHGGVFIVGEILEIRGSRFKIKSIESDELILKLLEKKE